MIDSNVAVKPTPSNNKLAKTASNVHKFGGSSLATAACIERVIDIIRQHCQLNDVIVVSANGNTTDSLFSTYQLASELEELMQLSAENAVKNSEIDSVQTQLSQAINALDIAQLTLINSLLNKS